MLCSFTFPPTAHTTDTQGHPRALPLSLHHQPLRLRLRLQYVGIARHSSTHSTAQHSTAQHSTAQHSTHHLTPPTHPSTNQSKQARRSCTTERVLSVRSITSFGGVDDRATYQPRTIMGRIAPSISPTHSTEPTDGLLTLPTPPTNRPPTLPPPYWLTPLHGHAPQSPTHPPFLLHTTQRRTRQASSSPPPPQSPTQPFLPHTTQRRTRTLQASSSARPSSSSPTTASSPSASRSRTPSPSTTVRRLGACFTRPVHQHPIPPHV